jgi:hypothetical protein
MSRRIDNPIQYALKFPATNPERMFKDGPPSREEVTTSFTCPDFVEVKTLTNSGMTAPASVPQVMIIDNFHQRVVSPPISGMRKYEAMNVKRIEMIEVIQTKDVKGDSKFIFVAFAYRARAIRSLMI